MDAEQREAYTRIARKWVKAWQDKHAFESTPDDREKYFLTFPIPYVNGTPHIGHAYSSMRADVHARYERLQGKNVLFPQGFHATGEPILGVVKRLREHDKQQEEILRKFGATDEDIERFRTEGAEAIVTFFKEKWVDELTQAAFSIDWTRTFITAIQPGFNAFIRWQYETLYEQGYIVKGTHPVVWCPSCQSPTGDHDRLKGEGESVQEWTLILLPLTTLPPVLQEHARDERVFLAAATLRPETIFGLTNVWVKPDAEYILARVDDKLLILNELTLTSLKDQVHTGEEITRVKGEALLGLAVENPVNGTPVPVLPAAFISMDQGSGIVMSVPAHAPYDYQQLKDLADAGDERAAQALSTARILFKLPDQPEGLPAQRIVEAYGVKSIADRDLLDKATKELYKREFHQAKPIIPELEGKRGEEAKALAISLLEEKQRALRVYYTTGPVVCRCTTRCHVKILEDQWFLNYADPAWKEKAKSLVKRMRILPEEARQQFLNTIDWLDRKACARKSGLGTPLPWDPEWIVETLSDSTIYMAYYTIADFINRSDIPVDALTRDVFDYIFLGKHEEEMREHEYWPTIRRMRESFLYYYPLDMRMSGKDLVQNHLTFFIMQHVAIFPEQHWPKGVSVNGYVNVRGEKMSKSKGNIIPLHTLLESYGPDIVRLTITTSAEGMDDADWQEAQAEAYASRLRQLEDWIRLANGAIGSLEGLTLHEQLLLDLFERAKQDGLTAMEAHAYRTASYHLFHRVHNAIRDYLKSHPEQREKLHVLKHVLTEWLLLLHPFIPTLSAEWYEQLTGGDVLKQRLPSVHDEYLHPAYPALRDEYEQLRKDIRTLLTLLERKREIPREIILTPAGEEAYTLARLVKEGNVRDVFQKEWSWPKEQLQKAVQRLRKQPLPEGITPALERELITSMKPLLEEAFNLPVTLGENQEKLPLPGKPGITIRTEKHE